VTAFLRLVTFAVGLVALVALGLASSDPAWTWPLSVVMGVLAFATAPRVIETWVVRRRVTAYSVLAWYCSVAVPFDVTQRLRTGEWQIDWMLGNILGSSVLYIAAGLVWNLDLTKARSWLAAGSASAIGACALLVWSWPS
jgi:hypothetical protein